MPALSTRRTETEVELQDGQTFAIAGLMNNTVTSTMSKIPGIGDIPILGYLFRSKAHQKNQTELVVMITPHDRPPRLAGRLRRPAERRSSPTSPRRRRRCRSPTPYIGSPRYPVNTPPKDEARRALPTRRRAGPAPAPRRCSPRRRSPSQPQAQCRRR